MGAGPVSTSESDSSASRVSKRSPHSLSTSEVEKVDMVSASDSMMLVDKSSNSMAGWSSPRSTTTSTESGPWVIEPNHAFNRACHSGFHATLHPPQERHTPQSHGGSFLGTTSSTRRFRRRLPLFAATLSGFFARHLQLAADTLSGLFARHLFLASLRCSLWA